MLAVCIYANVLLHIRSIGFEKIENGTLTSVIVCLFVHVCWK